MTLEDAKQLKAGDIIYAIPNGYLFTKRGLNADGTAMRYRVTSVKTWKTRPDEVRIKAKRGLYEHVEINQRYIDQFSLVDLTEKE